MRGRRSQWQWDKQQRRPDHHSLCHSRAYGRGRAVTSLYTKWGDLKFGVDRISQMPAAVSEA